jgi:hypothetical protein
MWWCLKRIVVRELISVGWLTVRWGILRLLMIGDEGQASRVESDSGRAQYQ